MSAAETPPDPSAAKTAQWDSVVSPAERSDTTEATAAIVPLADTQKLEPVQNSKRNIRRSTVRIAPPFAPGKNTTGKPSKPLPLKKVNLKSVYIDERKKELAQILPTLHPSGFTIRQATLLKMLGVVALCAIYHYVGFYAGKKAARDELDAELLAANDKLQLTDTTLRKFWLERTLWKYNNDSEKIVHWIWGQQGGVEFENLPEPPTREEFIQSLDEGLQAGLMTYAEYCGQLNRAAWHDWKTKEEAWKAFIDKPYRNFLPLYWFARKNSDVVTYIIEKKLPLSGLDAAASSRFLSWYLPHMEPFDQNLLVQELLGARFDPMALKRSSGTNAVARLYRRDFTLLPSRDFYIELDKNSAVFQDGKEICRLQFFTTNFYVGRAEDLRGTLYVYANLDERLKPSETLAMDLAGKVVFIQKYAGMKQVHSIPFFFSTGNVAPKVFEQERAAEEKVQALRKQQEEKSALDDPDPPAPAPGSPEESQENSAPTQETASPRTDANILRGELQDEPVPELRPRAGE